MRPPIVTDQHIPESRAPMPMPPLDLTIGAMRPDDWETVRRIYQEGLATGLASFETEAPGWPDWDGAHHLHSRLVACRGNLVVAWAALAPVSRRNCYAGVAEFSLYVAQSQRGHKVGRTLLHALIASSEEHGIWTLYGSTFPENQASIRLQTSCGFRVVGRRERIAQHHGLWRDTVITERRSRVVGVAIPGTPHYPANPCDSPPDPQASRGCPAPRYR